MIRQQEPLTHVKLAPWEGNVMLMRERMIFLLQDVSPNRGRYAYLEEQTGISAARWQNLFLRRLYPSMDMVYAAINLKKAYRNWLVFGFSAMPKPGEEPEEDRWFKFEEFQNRQKSAKEHLAELEAQKAAEAPDYD